MNDVLFSASHKIQISAWCAYDWASGAFSVIITTFIFATYFTTAIAPNQIIGTYQWANATAIAGIIIAIGSPFFGSIADHGGHHKRWLFFFTLLSVLSSAALWFAYPTKSSTYLVLSALVFGSIGLEIALVFYNAFLPYIAPKAYLGRISGWGWGSGYIGGIVALSIALLLFIQPPIPWLNTQSAEQIRICGPFVAIWYFLFALPLFYLVPDVPTKELGLPKAIKRGSLELWHTLKNLPKEKNVLLYLFSHMIYADGLNTLFAFGGIYAAGTYGLSFNEVLIFGITMNITAGLGAILLAWVDDYLGSKLTILVSLLGLIILGMPILFLHSKAIFWIVALILCIFVGPVQSASRSLMVRLIIDKEKSTEMFGLYALSGRITAFIGPWLLGHMTMLFSSQRAGMAVVLIFFALGAILLLPVRLSRVV